MFYPMVDLKKVLRSLHTLMLLSHSQLVTGNVQQIFKIIDTFR